jgi:hypothetical protein
MAQMVNFFSDASWIASISIVAWVVLLWLALTSGRGYTVEDTEAHSSNYAEVVNEGHGGIPAFLWVSFGAITIWVIYYFAVHWQEFIVIFALA